MSIALRFLSILIRKKIVVWGLLTAVLIFLLCAYSTNINAEEDRYESERVGGHKRLQNYLQNNIEPVQFIPGVPGHHNKLSADIPGPMDDRRAQIYKEQASLHNPKAYQIRDKAKSKLAHYQKHKQRKQDQELLDQKPEDIVYVGNGGNNPMSRQRGDQPQIENMGENVEYGPWVDDNSNNNNKQHQQEFGLALEGKMNNQGGGPVYFNQGPQYHGENNQGFGMESSTAEPQPYIPQQRIVHFDLKGAPPSVGYLKQILPLLAAQGATGILWEWEDTFPFSGRLSDISTNKYTVQQIKELLSLSASLGLESIPLVQTFGHMEFILKLDKYKHLRDNEDHPESICPCHNETFPLIQDYIAQVMDLHQGARYLHIGCDEVYHLGTCQPCQDMQRNLLFTAHVSKIANHAIANYGVKPIIWHDMLVNFMEEEMMPLGNLVEPMVWVYAEDVDRFMPSYTWDRFAAVFPYMWTASAYKGAHGETLVVPDSKRHLVNNLNWIKAMREQEQKLKGGFKGIVITGWQRFDHFAVLCELLPAALPSLMLDLTAVTAGYYNETLNSKLFKSLSCPDNIRHQSWDYDNDNFLWNSLSWCNFPGSQFFRVTERLVLLERDVNEFFDKVNRKKGWLTQYNKDHQFGSPFRIDELLEDWSRYQHETASLMRTASTALLEVFDYHTEGEWVEQKLYPIYKKLSKLRQEADDLKLKKSWPKRPFPINRSLQELGIGVPPTLPPPSPEATPRPKRRVQAPDLYSSRSRLRALGHR